MWLCRCCQNHKNVTKVCQHVDVLFFLRLVIHLCVYYLFWYGTQTCMITFSGNLQNLHEISWLARVFFVFGVFGWSCVVLFEGASSYKEMPELSWSIWARKNWAALPLNCSKIGHSYEAFKYLFDGNISTPLLYAIKNSSADLLNSWVMRNFWIIWKYQMLEFSRRDLIRFFLIVNKLSPRIRIRTFLKFVARANERSVVRNFDCSEKRSWCILAKKLCEFFTWVS